jgi:Fur family iron response transcriptional regulator
LALGALLFTGAHRHVTGDSLFEEARAAGTEVSVATVYNTLHELCDAGLLRAVNLDSDRRWFDTDVGAHHHFIVEDTGELIDIPEHSFEVARLPEPPQGYAVEGVDVLVRLKPRSE